jgi:tetratricopeptide (TPR) repeat protein
VAETLFLHVGAHKTGSTSIQQSFFESRAALKRHGVAYFDYAANHSAAIYWLFSERRNRYHVTLKMKLSKHDLEQKIEEIDRGLKSFMRDRTSPKKVISGEDISALSDEEIKRLKDYLDEASSCEKKVIIYVRNFYEFLDSTVQELVKNGASLASIEAALAGRGNSVVPRYGYRIRKFQNHFGPENVDIRVFDRRLFKSGDLLADFCDAIGAPDLFRDLKNVSANTSISAESVQIMNKYNELFPLQVGDGYNAARTEKVKSYFAITEGAKFRVADPKLLAAYDRLIADDAAFIRQTLDQDLAASVLERRGRAVEGAGKEVGSIDIDLAFRAVGRMLLDLDSSEKALDVALNGLPKEITESDALVSLAKNVKFIMADGICRQLSRAFMRADKLECARALAERALELGPKNSENHLLAGDIFWRQGEWSKVERAYARGIVADPNNAAAYRKLSACLLKLRRNDEAAKAALKAAEMAPGNEEYQVYLRRFEAGKAAGHSV